jgi:hypothetical protein
MATFCGRYIYSIKFRVSNVTIGYIQSAYNSGLHEYYSFSYLSSLHLTKMTNGKDARERRRSMVLELDSQGYSHREIVANYRYQRALLAMTWPILERKANKV